MPDPRPEVWQLTVHAVRRYRERWFPGASFGETADDLRRALLAGTFQRTERPSRGPEDGVAFLRVVTRDTAGEPLTFRIAVGNSGGHGARVVTVYPAEYKPAELDHHFKRLAAGHHGRRRSPRRGREDEPTVEDGTPARARRPK